jgi:perosamine synthetase
MMIPIYSPRVFTESAVQALQSGWISSQGEFIERTRNALCTTLNVPYTVLTNNGTTATHMLIKALRYKYPSIKRIYVPNHVFVAVWNVILYEFPPDAMSVLEMNPETLNMRTDEEYLRSLEPNSAVFVVHNVGNIINVPRMKQIRPDLIFLEDNCEGLFGTYNGIYSGCSEASLCSAVSFFANKTLTCGEGGAFFTHDKDLFEFIYKTIHHGLSGQKYIYDILGMNCRMTNIQAALLYDQLVHRQEIQNDKEKLFNTYTKELEGFVTRPVPEDGTTPSNWMFCCSIPGTYQAFEAFMKEKGIDVRPFFYDIHAHAHLQSIPRPEASCLTKTFVMLPSYPDLNSTDIAYICKSVKEYCLTQNPQK